MTDHRDTDRPGAPPPVEGQCAAPTEGHEGDSRAVASAADCPEPHLVVGVVQVLHEIAERVAARVGPEDEEKVREWERDQAYRRGLSALWRGEAPKRIIRLYEGGFLDEASDVVVRLRKHIAAGFNIAVLAGPPGTGKTTAACVAMIDEGNGYFVRADRLSVILSTRRGLTSPEHIIKHASRTSSPLVLDDVGTPQEAQGAMERFLSERYDDSESVTVVTTNLTAKAFRGRYGERVWSRLCHVGKWMDCDRVLRPDRRGKK